MELATLGSAVRLVSVARHVINCATRHGIAFVKFNFIVSQVKIIEMFERKIKNILLPIISNKCFGCPKELSH